jgi:hypothetical protein
MAIKSSESTERLVLMFRENSLAQDETYISGNTRKYSKLYFLNVDIVKELIKRPGDERRALLALLRDENPHVRLQAAKFAYPVAPAESRACLEAIRAAKLPDQSLDAGMTLRQLRIDPHCLDRT